MATFDAANLSAAFDNPVPVAVTKLDYYGRQVEVQAAAGDTVALYSLFSTPSLTSSSGSRTSWPRATR
jgi:hypothetical protein